MWEVFLNLFFKNKSDYLTDLFGVYYNFILQKNNIYRNEDFNFGNMKNMI